MRAVSRTLGSTPLRAAMVKATTMGVARINSPITMAVGVNNSSKGPRGPWREKKAKTESPTTTVGRAIRVLMRVITLSLPRKFPSTRRTARGIPAAEAKRVAPRET